MSETRGDMTFARAERIVAQSRLAGLVERIVWRVVDAVRTSRWVAAARRRVEGLQAMPADERARCAIWLVSAAIAGHIVLALMLPPLVRPTPSLSTAVLLALCLIVSALAARRP